MSAPIETSVGRDLAPARRAASPVLIRLDAPEPQTIRLNRALTIIGAKGHAHLRIISSEISGSHAVLLNVGNNVFLRDLMSRTHTYVNDRQVSECRLKYGDVLRFGEMRFRFVDLDVLRQSLAGARTSPAELLQDGAATPLAVCSPIFVIGRQRGADMRLSGKLVSKVHAILYEHAGKHILRDLSSQGTLVDGQRIRSVELEGGETIEICGLHVRYRSSPSAELVKAPATQPPEAATAPLHSARLDADSSAHAEEEENDAPGEQHVFAPEPEILSPATASRPGSPDDGLQTLEPEEDSVWEHAENAGDLIDWGITLEPEITGPATSPEAVTALQERSGVHAGVVTALPNPSDTGEIVAPMSNICVISEPVDLTMLRRETARPVEARAAAAPQAMRTTETKTSASPPQSTLDGILGQGILTMAPVDELTEEAAPARSRAAPRRLFRLLWVAIIAGLLLALAVVAWWYRYRNR